MCLSVDDVNLEDDLVNFKEVTTSNNDDKQIKAMNEELDSTNKNYE